MATTITTNSYWNNISSDQLFDFDDLFSSTFNFVDNNEYEEISSSTNSSSQEYHSPNLICGVCGAVATGYNFDQITCESCKAFFRRNALRDMATLKCRFTGSCVINIRTRRHCAYCRLKKCFDIKMRRDWIRTDEEKELRQLQKLVKEQKKLNQTTNDQLSLLNLPIVVRKKKRLMIKSTIQESIIKPIYTQTFFGYNRNLSGEDRILLNNITNAYQLVADQVDDLHQNKYTPPPQSLVEFVNRESKMHESLISFYKSIPQFNQLDIKDRVLLIKFNLVRLIHLHCILIQKFQESPLIGSYMSKWINEDFHRRMSRTRQYFDRFIEHPLILKLALIVFIFSTNLTTSDCIDPSDDYINKRNIYAIQDFYTTVLWRYLNRLYGEREAIRSMEIITTQILHLQTLMDIMEGHIKQERDSDTCNPLESCLFRLT